MSEGGDDLGYCSAFSLKWLSATSIMMSWLETILKKEDFGHSEVFLANIPCFPEAQICKWEQMAWWMHVAFTQVVLRFLFLHHLLTKWPLQWNKGTGLQASQDWPTTAIKAKAAGTECQAPVGYVPPSSTLAMLTGGKEDEISQLSV